MRKYRWWIGLCLAILLVGIIGSARALLAPVGNRVEIVQDGTVLYTLELDNADDQELRLEYAGRHNTVQVAAGRIRVVEAECPDQTCVHMGWLTSSALPIVCLPNHLVIRFAEPDAAEVDAVTR